MFTFIVKQNRYTKLGKVLLFSALALGLSACHDDDDTPKIMTPPPPPPPPPPAEYSYNITLTNLTYAQPLSPLAVMLHSENEMWMTGSIASESLEKLAEGGDNTDLLAEASVLASASGTEAILPGATSSVTVSTTDRMATHFTSATMLVNTNDAFSGLTGVDISTMAVDESKSWSLNVYDSGTEANSEAVGTIPGSADGGIGFDAARDDVNFVAYHSGVVSQDDGLASSVLTQGHRFDNPAIKLTITRTK